MDKEAVNVELAERVIKQIEAHPDTWYQGAWKLNTPCGTRYCFAGHAAILSGYAVMGNMGMGYVIDENGQEHMITPFVAKLLDINRLDAGVLFFGTNTLDDIKWMINELKEGRSVVGRTPPLPERTPTGA